MIANKKGWVVLLEKAPPVIYNDFPDGYFPRRFVYKKDAEMVAVEVRSKGGRARVVKAADWYEAGRIADSPC